MIKQFLLSFFLICLTQTDIISQTDLSLQDWNKYVLIEKMILESKNDSAKMLLSKFDTNNDTSYLLSLNRLVKNKINANDDFYDYLVNIIEDGFSPLEIHHFITENIEPSSDRSKFEYIKICWLDMMQLLDSGYLKDAEQVFNKFNLFIKQYKGDKEFNIKAHVYKNIYLSVMDIIGNKPSKTRELYGQNLLLVNKVNDSFLSIINDYYCSNLFVMDNDLEGYIDLSIKNIKLITKIKKGEVYKYKFIKNLLDGYLHKGGMINEIDSILTLVYQNPRFRKISYSFYVQFMGILPNEHILAKKIYKQFGVNTLPELCDTFLELSEGRLVENEYYQLLRLSSLALKNKKYYNKAIQLKDESIKSIRKIYTKDLSAVLSLNENRRIHDLKDYEVSIERQKTKIYKYISIGSVIFLLLLGWAFWLQYVKNIKLSEMSKKLKVQDSEKQVLLKELHHRVKNNFQVILGLFDIDINKNSDNTELSNFILNGKNRIKSMAMIHSKLYENNSAELNLHSYTTQLIYELSQTYSYINLDSYVVIDSSYMVDMDTALVVGLIINELVVNSFKHGFVDSRRNSLTITFEQGKDRHLLKVKDNGDGLPMTFEDMKINSTGLQLAALLSKQVHGTLEYQFDNGSIFKLSFKDSKMRQLVD